VLKLFSIKALLGEAKNSLAILMGRTLKIAQLFAHRLQKLRILSEPFGCLFPSVLSTALSTKKLHNGFWIVRLNGRSIFCLCPYPNNASARVV
ncbi:TPA: hypothetical protein ACUUD3_002789, partial [Pseudomonas aeruginosa]